MIFHITTSQGTGALVSFSVTNHSTFQPFHYSTSLTLQFRPILSFSVILNLFQDLHVILRRTSRRWKALAIPVYCECEKPKDLLKNFTVILRLSRRIPLKRHEILRAPPSEWHVRGAMGFFGRFTPSEWHDLDKMGQSWPSPAGRWNLRIQF